MIENFKKQLILNLGIIIFIFLSFFLLLEYFDNLISKKSTEIEQSRKNNILYNKSLANLAKFKEMSSVADLYHSKLILLLPPKDNLIELPIWINNISKINEVNVNFNFKPGGEDSGPNKVGFENFSMDVVGSLSNIEKFLYNIEHNSPKFIINIDSFNISEISSNNYQLSATGKVFFK